MTVYPKWGFNILDYSKKKFFSFKGNWNFYWVIHRYLRTAKCAISSKRLINALYALIEMKTGKTYVRSRPSVLRIEPTNLCNLRCPRCSCGIGSDPREKGYMNLEDYRLVLEENKKNAMIVRLDGNGESMLHPEIFEMITIAKSYNYAVSLSTNFTTDLCGELDKFIDSGLDRLIIAVDGSTQDIYERYRVGGNLKIVEDRVVSLLNMRKRFKKKKPFVEIQFLDWGYNHNDIPAIRQKVHKWGADKLEIINPDWAVSNVRADPNNPKRCFWLWFVLTVDWKLNYHSCTNAWTFPWPRMNFKDVPMEKFWNNELMIEARKYNIDKSSTSISNNNECHCNNCSDMLVVDRPPGYVCE